MGQLGDLLEVLHDADRLRTFHGEFRVLTRPRASGELIVHAEDSGEGPRLRWTGAGPFPRASTTSRRIWFEHPDNIRVELARGRHLERFGVRNGENWWRWDRSDGPTTGSLSSPGHARAFPPMLNPPLLTPAMFVASFRLEPSGRGTRVGREVLLARARPRNQPKAEGGLAFEFEFDAEHGVVLRHTVLDEGRSVVVTEALAVCFDAPIDPERFVFISPDGRPAEAIEERWRGSRVVDARDPHNDHLRPPRNHRV